MNTNVVYLLYLFLPYPGLRYNYKRKLSSVIQNDLLMYMNLGYTAMTTMSHTVSICTSLWLVW